MKTLILILIVFFGAVYLTPRTPIPYPPQEVLQRRDAIVFKEAKIEMLINKIEHEVKVDSIQINQIKK